VLSSRFLQPRSPVKSECRSRVVSVSDCLGSSSAGVGSTRTAPRVSARNRIVWCRISHGYQGVDRYRMSSDRGMNQSWQSSRIVTSRSAVSGRLSMSLAWVVERAMQSTCHAMQSTATANRVFRNTVDTRISRHSIPSLNHQSQCANCNNQSESGWYRSPPSHASGMNAVLINQLDINQAINHALVDQCNSSSWLRSAMQCRPCAQSIQINGWSCSNVHARKNGSNIGMLSKRQWMETGTGDRHGHRLDSTTAWRRRPSTGMLLCDFG